MGRPPWTTWAKRYFRIKETSNSLENPQSLAEPEPPTECDASMRRCGKRARRKTSKQRETTERWEHRKTNLTRQKHCLCQPESDLYMHFLARTGRFRPQCQHQEYFFNWWIFTTVPRAPACPLHCRSVTPRSSETRISRSSPSLREVRD